MEKLDEGNLPASNTAPKQIDWPHIEKLYRLGQMTVREIARQCNVQASSITRRAERHGWAHSIAQGCERRTAANGTKVDWDSVARDIRAGILTDREIGEKHEKSLAAIQLYAKESGTERNLADRVRQRAATKLAKALAAEATSQHSEKLTEREMVEIAADVQVAIALEQQARISRLVKISDALVVEFESQCADRATRETLTTAFDSLKQAAEIEKLLFDLERRAFGIRNKMNC